MFKTTLFAAALLAASPALAQNSGDPVLDSMARHWAEYDYACRGTNPSDGSEGFCGARAYIAWVMGEHNLCLHEQQTQDSIFIACDQPGAFRVSDPISDELRSTF